MLGTRVEHVNDLRVTRYRSLTATISRGLRAESKHWSVAVVGGSQWWNREDMLWCSCLLLLVLSGVATAQEGKRTVAVP